MPDVARAKPRLLDLTRQACRVRHFSHRTEEAYCQWIRRFIVFCNKRHPSTLGPPDVSRFLSSLATDGGVSTSTQNQALCGVLFLYRAVLELYGSGLRLLECLELRVKDLDFERRQVTVRQGKGRKQRTSSAFRRSMRTT